MTESLGNPLYCRNRKLVAIVNRVPLTDIECSHVRASVRRLSSSSCQLCSRLTIQLLLFWSERRAGYIIFYCVHARDSCPEWKRHT